ncbi:MAG: alcohol dehydrogenase AdhP [Tistrella sp.]|uniref:alcohol dehydrogenase n=2 Tax=Tistrella mobilis TaxID=171437 RepID=I3TPT1_TISMK|nr:alcohol dehydrogenase AdhP [Tistrella sp.]AFK54769.1 alcohol dehydrogenase [Tistrella mobilis KA081020-065]MAD37897.1 alcohol dehydrogenase AdhP [Tistrella sp.]MAM74605.1 alcohol dehydrogenase AdhP [Tistrella sp.]MBA78595.1 alcohol dehydrogenase AdhP [Tistrella sp.]
MSLPNTMKAAVVRAFGQPLVIDEVPVPRPDPGQVLIKVVASGVCHTDLHAAEGDWPVKPEPPFIPGHEGVGYVAAVGAGVRSVKEGDRVGVPWLHTACGHCEHCITGWETLCGDQQNTGYSVDGGFADYVLADPAYVGHLPQALGFEAAAPILCAGVTVYKGIKETEARPGQWLVVSGVGGLGHLAVQYGKAMGLHVAAVDIGDEKLALARRLGADVALDARDPEVVQKMITETEGGAHGVLVTAVSEKAFAQAADMLRRRGIMALCGLPPGTFPISIFNMVLNRRTIRGSIVGTRADLAECLTFAGEGKVAATYSTARLEDVNDVFDRMRAGKIEGRVVLKI